MALNQIDGELFSAIAASSNPTLKFAPFGRRDATQATHPLTSFVMPHPVPLTFDHKP